jgi:hypothetical protein
MPMLHNVIEKRQKEIKPRFQSDPILFTEDNFQERLKMRLPDDHMTFQEAHQRLIAEFGDLVAVR